MKLNNRLTYFFTLCNFIMIHFIMKSLPYDVANLGVASCTHTNFFIHPTKTTTGNLFFHKRRVDQYPKNNFQNCFCIPKKNNSWSVRVQIENWYGAGSNSLVSSWVTICNFVMTWVLSLLIIYSPEGTYYFYWFKQIQQ